MLGKKLGESEQPWPLAPYIIGKVGFVKTYAGQGFPQQGNLRFFRPFHFLKLVNLDLNLPIMVL